jgi:hypothetical protein
MQLGQVLSWGATFYEDVCTHDWDHAERLLDRIEDAIDLMKRERG